jgi:hypothetical protein
MSPGRSSSTRLMTCVTGSQLLACKASSRLQVGRGFTLWLLFNRKPTGTKLRRLLKRLRGQWPRKGQTVMSPQWRSGHAAPAFLLTICETTAAPLRSQPIRHVHCRGHQSRYPSIGRNFRPDSVQTTSLSETYCTGFHLSNETLGKAFSSFVGGCRNSSMSRDGSEHLPKRMAFIRVEAEAVNCGYDPLRAYRPVTHGRECTFDREHPACRSRRQGCRSR